MKMFGKYLTIVSLILLPIFVNTSLISAAFPTPLKTYYYSAQTTTDGRFEVPHGISAPCPPCGMIVSVRNLSNQGWYTTHQADGLNVRFAYDQNKVSGVIEHKDYKDTLVHIILFVPETC